MITKRELIKLALINGGMSALCLYLIICNKFTEFKERRRNRKLVKTLVKIM